MISQTQPYSRQEKWYQDTKVGLDVFYADNISEHGKTITL